MKYLFFVVFFIAFFSLKAQDAQVYSSIKTGNVNQAEMIKIAIMLPFFAEEQEVSDTLLEIPARSKVALELYEGFETALKENEEFLTKSYYIKVLDTRRDIATVESQLSELANFKPDLVIGEIYNRQTRIISDWAEKNGVVQIVPLSPTHSLIEGKNNVFLLNPSTFTHGKKMAEYAFRDLGLRNMLIFSDGKAATYELAKSFEEQFSIMGGFPKTITIDSVFDKAQAQINAAKNEMATAQGVYIPINNEEIMGLFLAIIDMQRWKLKVMTLPEIMYFDRIDLDLKERLKIYFSNTYNPDEESEPFLNYLQQHVLEITAPPSTFQIQGYDMGTYLLQVLEQYEPEKHTLVETLEDFLPVSTLHSDVYFEREHDNQAVKIMQMTEQGIE